MLSRKLLSFEAEKPIRWDLFGGVGMGGGRYRLILYTFQELWCCRFHIHPQNSSVLWLLRVGRLLPVLGASSLTVWKEIIPNTGHARTVNLGKEVGGGFTVSPSKTVAAGDQEYKTVQGQGRVCNTTQCLKWHHHIGSDAKTIIMLPCGHS